MPPAWKPASARTCDEGGGFVPVGRENVSEEDRREEVRFGVVAGEGAVHAVGEGRDVVVHAERVVQTGVEAVTLVGDGDGRSARVGGDEKEDV